MSTENSVDLPQLDIIKHNTNRKIYQRDDFFKYYCCTEEIPEYLKDFQFLHNNFREENWYKKPIPKFVDAVETKGKSIFTKTKVRQRTLSSQSGEYEYQENYNRQRNYTSNGKYNRFSSSPNDTNAVEECKIEPVNGRFINCDDFPDNQNTQWHKVESRTNRFNNATKPYSQNIQLTENHWKKWTKDTNPSVVLIDKTHRQYQQQNSPFNRLDKSGNTWTRKSESEVNPRNPKIFGRHNVLKSGDQTEDIWQDDWDTEMKSEIGKEELDINLDSYEFPKSSILSTTPPPLEVDSKPPEPIVESPKSPQFDLWFYRDLSNIERGPFQSEDMANWLATGYFNPTTFVRRSCDEKFLLLAEYRALYGRIPFTAGPTVPPILLNTPIELEPNQILIGVENNLRQQVINCAVSLSHIPHRVEENINVSPNAIIEEKRLLDESRAELEREKERMIQEQIQWRLRVEADLRATMNAELNAKIAEMMKQSTTVKHVESVDQVIPVDHIITESELSSTNMINEVVENLPEPQDIGISTVVLEPKFEPVVEKWEIDESNIEQVLNTTGESNKWFSSKDMKIQKKNKKTKAKENKSAKEEKKITPIPEAKPPEQPTDSRLIIVSRESSATAKENDIASKMRPIRIELENRKSDPSSIWGSIKAATPVNTTSLIQIQAEESIKMKKEKKLSEPEIQSTVVQNTSPKETFKVEQVKSIWNAVSQAPQKLPNQSGIESKVADNNYIASKDSDKSIKERGQNVKESQLKVKVDGAVKSKTVETGNRKNKQSKSTNLSDSNKIPLFTEKEKSMKNDMPALIKPSPVVIATKSLLEIQAEETLKEKQAKEQQETLKNLETTNEKNQKKAETPSTWKSGQTLSQNIPTAAKFLVEIQAEEALKAKKSKEIENAMKVNQIETNKVTSFKESLMKTSKPAQIIPVGKSIWDMLPAEVPVNKQQHQQPEYNSKPQNQNEPPNPVHKQQKQPIVSKKEIESDQLTKWCLKKLVKFSEEFELNTVIELLKEVPNEEVMEMAIQLMGDSKFTSNFVLEFITKRQELSDNQAGDTWQTVKKSIPSPPAVNNSKGKTGKSKSKKKMVVIETKFR